MKKKILSLLLIMFLSIGVFAGCNKIKLSGGPQTNDPVTSNGGMVAQKGDYLYFVNGYEKIENLEDGDNDYNKVNHSAIYRAKTNNGILSYDEDGKLKDVELLVPKVVGCENGSFFIFGDYLYFASPTTGKDSSFTVRFDLLDFFCCKLDGSKVKKLHETDQYTENATFNMVSKDGKVYIEIFDGSKFTVLTVEGNKVKDKNVYAENETVTSFVMPKVETYNTSNNLISDNELCIYYTRELNESDVAENYLYGNVTVKLNVVTGQETILLRDNENGVTLIDYAENQLYFKAQHKNTVRPDYLVYHSDVNSVLAVGTDSAFVPFETENVYVVPSDNGVFRGVILRSDNQLRMSNGYTNVVSLYDGALTVLKVDGNYVYGYNSDNKLITIDLKSKEVKILTNTDAVIDFTLALNLDICGTHAYYFNTYTGDNDVKGFYLNRVELNKVEQVGELVGELLEEHIKTETEETTEE